MTLEESRDPKNNGRLVKLNAAGEEAYLWWFVKNGIQEQKATLTQLPNLSGYVNVVFDNLSLCFEPEYLEFEPCPFTKETLNKVLKIIASKKV